MIFVAKFADSGWKHPMGRMPSGHIKPLGSPSPRTRRGRQYPLFMRERSFALRQRCILDYRRTEADRPENRTIEGGP